MRSANHATNKQTTKQTNNQTTQAKIVVPRHSAEQQIITYRAVSCTFPSNGFRKSLACKSSADNLKGFQGGKAPNVQQTSTRGTKGSHVEVETSLFVLSTTTLNMGTQLLFLTSCASVKHHEKKRATPTSEDRFSPRLNNRDRRSFPADTKS